MTWLWFRLYFFESEVDICKIVEITELFDSLERLLSLEICKKKKKKNYNKLEF